MLTNSPPKFLLALRSLAFAFVLALLSICGGAFAQAAQRATGEIGTTVLGALPEVPLYWHLDTYPNQAAAGAVAVARSAVADSFGKVWLLTIAEIDWRPSGGTRVATIGPLPLLGKGGHFTASYFNATTSPGYQTDVHQHGGPEALYTLSGEVCIETPQGKMVGRAGGDPLLVAGNLPMRLTSVGIETRRSIVLVLHDSSQRWKVPASGWTPRGLCSAP